MIKILPDGTILTEDADEAARIAAKLAELNAAEKRPLRPKVAGKSDVSVAGTPKPLRHGSTQERRFELFQKQCPNEETRSFFTELRNTFGNQFYVGAAPEPWASLRRPLENGSLRSFAHFFPGGKHGETRIESYRRGERPDPLTSQALELGLALGLRQFGCNWILPLGENISRLNDIVRFLKAAAGSDDFLMSRVGQTGGDS